MVDNNEIPREKVVMRLPYLEFWIHGNKYVYEGRFDGLAISSFIRKIGKPTKTKQMNP